MTDTQRMQIKELRLAGYGYKKIAQALGLSVDTVKSYCRKNNLAGVMAGNPTSSANEKTYCKKCGKELLQKTKSKRSYCFVIANADKPGGILTQM